VGGLERLVKSAFEGNAVSNGKRAATAARRWKVAEMNRAKTTRHRATDRRAQRNQPSKKKFPPPPPQMRTQTFARLGKDIMQAQ